MACCLHAMLPHRQKATSPAAVACKAGTAGSSTRSSTACSHDWLLPLVVPQHAPLALPRPQPLQHQAQARDSWDGDAIHWQACHLAEVGGPLHQRRQLHVLAAREVVRLRGRRAVGAGGGCPARWAEPAASGDDDGSTHRSHCGRTWTGHNCSSMLLSTATCRLPPAAAVAASFQPAACPRAP